MHLRGFRMPEQKTEKLIARAAPTMARAIRRAARIEGVSMSEFVRAAASHRARNVLARNEEEATDAAT